jgi:hypothetical protein
MIGETGYVTSVSFTATNAEDVLDLAWLPSDVAKLFPVEKTMPRTSARDKNHLEHCKTFFNFIYQPFLAYFA